MLFVDIDGCVVEFDIQQYVGAIEMFGNEPIRDFEYMIECVKYMLHRYKELNRPSDETQFIEENVLTYVRNNLLESLKESRDCFLEYDNYVTTKDKIDYLIRYEQGGCIVSPRNLPKIYRYLQQFLVESYQIIQKECARAEEERESPKLPFPIMNVNNDIIRDTINGLDVNETIYLAPIKRAESAINRLKNIIENDQQDMFLKVTKMVGVEPVVDYHEIYSHKHLVLGVRDTLEKAVGNNVFPRMMALSHHTGNRESMAKEQLFINQLPFIEFKEGSLLKYHTENARMGIRRKRSSKAFQALKIMGTNSLSGMYLIDDSVDNLIPWFELGGNAILYRPRTKEEVVTGVDQRVDPRLIRMFNWNLPELERVKTCCEEHHKKMIKK